MALDEETIAKLTTSLAGDIELFNTVINDQQTQVTQQKELETKMEEVNTKLQETEARNTQYLGQISNLLSRIPVSNTGGTSSNSQRLEEIKSQKWTK